MNRLYSVALLVLVLGSITIRSEAMAPRGDEKPSRPEATANDAEMTAKFLAIKAEFDADLTRCRQATENIQDQAEMTKIYRKMAPDDVVYSRRMVELALTAPKTTGARDALLWVIDHPEGPTPDRSATSSLERPRS